VYGIFAVNMNVDGLASGGGSKILTMPGTFPETQVSCSHNWVDDVIVCATGNGGGASHLIGSWFATYRHSDGVFVRSYVPSGLPADASLSNMQIGVVGYTGISNYEYVMYDRVSRACGVFKKNSF
jgi:hypothetical protein